MMRSGPALLLFMGLLPATAALAAGNAPASTTTAAAAKAATMSAPASTALPATARTVAPAAVAMPAANMPVTANPLPARGMDMANVEHIYGAPLEKLAPVPTKGTAKHPPITRWIYPRFVVYFEYDHVVHAVIKAHPFKDAGNHSG